MWDGECDGVMTKKNPLWDSSQQVLTPCSRGRHIGQREIPGPYHISAGLLIFSLLGERVINIFLIWAGVLWGLFVTAVHPVLACLLP